MSIFYVIRHKDDWDLFWSNEDGWVGTEAETRFTLEEYENLDAPIDGVWVHCFDEIYQGEPQSE